MLHLIKISSEIADRTSELAFSIFINIQSLAKLLDAPGIINVKPCLEAKYVSNFSYIFMKASRRAIFI